MSRLIDADEMRNGWIDGINEPIYCANDVLDDIDKQPTVDAVEVVRCKNCIWYHKAHVKCSHGERKGGAK